MATSVTSKSTAKELAGVISEARYQVSHGRLQRTMALMAAFAAMVSGFEAYIQHMRGAFNHWLMWTPVFLTPPTVLAAFAAVLDRRATRTILPWLSLAMLVDGIVGFVFHLRGVGRMPGGFKLATYNITMGPPLFAPLLLTSVGVLGVLSALLRRERLGKGAREG